MFGGTSTGRFFKDDGKEIGLKLLINSYINFGLPPVYTSLSKNWHFSEQHGLVCLYYGLYNAPHIA